MLWFSHTCDIACQCTANGQSNRHLRKIRLRKKNFAARIIWAGISYIMFQMSNAIGWLSARKFANCNDLCLLHRVVCRDTRTTRFNCFSAQKTPSDRQQNHPKIKSLDGGPDLHTTWPEVRYLYVELHSSTTVIAKTRQRLSMRRLQAELKRNALLSAWICDMRETIVC